MKRVVNAELFTAIFCLMTFAICSVVFGAESELNRVECDVHAGACRGHISETTVSLDIEPKPVKAMHDLTFTVAFAGEKAPAAPYIDLGMPGMNMGRNRVSLKRIKESLYQGTGVIVR